MQNIYYWSPCLEKVGTYWATINSAIAFARYTKKYKIRIINVCGEWDSQKEYLQHNNIELINLGLSYFKYLPKSGYLLSRISYFTILLISIFPLIKFFKKNNSDFLIIHLLTSLPLILNFFIKNKLKIVLRISGYPNLNYFRLYLWKILSKKLFFITCPSKDLKFQLKKLKVFSKSNLFFLPDPIVYTKKFVKKFSKITDISDIPSGEYFISVGRLTKQKNFTYLIKEFNKFLSKKNDVNLLIFGEGEQKNILKNLIAKFKLEKRIFLMGYSENIYYFMRNAKGFILSSLWEDPGFVLIEAGMCNLAIISSNCKNGPSEFLQDGKGGMLFESNKKNALSNSLENFKNDQDIFKKKIIAKKNCLKYTLFRHYREFDKILSYN
jgi:glycosyltransferase involved in cell wall biosynthesis